MSTAWSWAKPNFAFVLQDCNSLNSTIKSISCSGVIYCKWISQKKIVGFTPWGISQSILCNLNCIKYHYIKSLLFLLDFRQTENTATPAWSLYLNFDTIQEAFSQQTKATSKLQINYILHFIIFKLAILTIIFVI